MQRPDRFFSHAVVELRKIQWLPIFCQSGILLDLSQAGFKIEVMGTVKNKANERFWLHLPLAAFGIQDLPNLSLRAEAKWVDHAQCRIGGVFVDVDSHSKDVIDRILARLAGKAQAKI
jgi:hypothetical protein